MRERYPSILSFSIVLSALIATPVLAQDQHCGTSEARAALLARDPHLPEREAAAEADLQQQLALRENEDTAVHVVPVVFHVLHFLGDENISDQQIFDQMVILNRDYRKLNADVNTACCGFPDIAGDIRLQFRLAQLDPYGNCTNGIDRIQTLRTFNANDTSKLHPWFRERYLNIWVANSLEDQNVAAYAYLPPDMEGSHSIADGIITRYTYVGNNARVLTHEIGHWLNLRHTWGPGNTPGLACGDDLVDDTPITKGYSFCPSPEQSKICDPDVYENYQNYMDYSNCNVMFTEGQKDRMRAAINSTIAGRNNVWTDANRLLTGTEDGHVSQCAPQANFYSYVLNSENHQSYPLACAGVPIQFRDNSTVADPTSWEWQFPGGTPSTSSEENPVVTYAQGGIYSATLTVSNAYGSSSITRLDMAIISPTYSDVQGLLQEPFNDQAAADRWPVLDLEHNQTTWAWTNVAGHNSDGCYRINASDIVDFTNPIGSMEHDIDELVTPTMDLTGVSNGTLSFWYAASTQAGNTADVEEKLEVYTTYDCGANWQLRKTIDAPEIITAGTSGAGYVPIAGDWRQVTVSIPPILQTDNVRFKFTYTSSIHSNDLFIDDINIDATVGIDEADANAVQLDLLPNPARDQVTITVNTPAAGTLSLVDMTGRMVHRQAVGIGAQRIDLDLTHIGLTSGVYLVQLDHANGRQVRRLVVR